MRATTFGLTIMSLLVGIGAAGCQDPLRVDPVAVEHGSGQVQPLTVQISGPRMVSLKGTYIWEAKSSGAGAADTYQWEMRVPASGTRYALGTQRTQTKTVYANDDRFELTVTVTSAMRNATVTLVVTECIDGCLAANAAVP